MSALGTGQCKGAGLQHTQPSHTGALGEHQLHRHGASHPEEGRLLSRSVTHTGSMDGVTHTRVLCCDGFSLFHKDAQGFDRWASSAQLGRARPEMVHRGGWGDVREHRAGWGKPGRGGAGQRVCASIPAVPSPTLRVPHETDLTFFMFILFLRERETEWERGKDRERERERETHRI